ncbi:hypothetical protein FDB72_00880 [Clostridium botulinum]|uniref:class II lanthipeptide, LchA2/BrtA2 family n=1 Tax=Clostridium botulinum TaxID=1491 RepID=UPI0001F84ED4|nr:class II lanthipeptide, LchA2/BrtA2 family [Clostridium botulinum]NFB15830.1 hypothetical protein [Clostridium botulinum]NFB66254.1 hypothetical protein [Clostridium botulinum]NFB97052.1 hypothetical protein [Clostridium botulinum]NFC45782.1 hypothetical protein [Clostridium botulinum]NFC57625.1 hypothetical protein [Clostridium botulinum]
MKNNEVCKNAGFISEDELVELVDNSDISGGTAASAAAVSATVASATAVSALFTVTSACTTKCK